MLNAQNLAGLGIAAGIALLLTLAYFLVAHAWTNLANPIAGTVAVIAGVIGFAVASAIDARRTSRPRSQQIDGQGDGS
jgi:glucose uptake protein GlcU